MSEQITIIQGNKEEKYLALLPQIEALIKDENDLIANMANVCAAIKQTFDFLWIGFYLVKQNQLVLGPFQGPVACTRIHKGKGVCGTAWLNEQIIVVPDVDLFPGHIACNSLSKSEIVLPLFDSKKNVFAVFDIDSEDLNTFDEIDKKYLNEIVLLIKA